MQAFVFIFLIFLPRIKSPKDCCLISIIANVYRSLILICERSLHIFISIHSHIRDTRKCLLINAAVRELMTLKHRVHVHILPPGHKGLITTSILHILDWWWNKKINKVSHIFRCTYCTESFLLYDREIICWTCSQIYRELRKTVWSRTYIFIQIRRIHWHKSIGESVSLITHC